LARVTARAHLAERVEHGRAAVLADEGWMLGKRDRHARDLRVTAQRASQVLRRRDLILTPDYRRERPPLYRPPTVSLQTGTGTAQTTAISTVAITAVIFSLVDRSMASSGSGANLGAALYAAWVFTL
jgi:hypothetical protein